MSGEGNSLLRDELTGVAELVEEIAARKLAGTLTPDQERTLRAQAALRLERAAVACFSQFAERASP